MQSKGLERTGKFLKYKSNWERPQTGEDVDRDKGL